MNSFLLLSADYGSWHEREHSGYFVVGGRSRAERALTAGRSVRAGSALWPRLPKASPRGSWLFSAGRWDVAVSKFQFGKIRHEGLIYILKQLSLEEIML